MDDTNTRIGSRPHSGHRRQYPLAPQRSAGHLDPTHSIAVCETVRDTLATATASLQHGLHVGEPCIATGTPSFLADLEAALTARGIDVATARERGDLTLRPVSETYLASEPVTAESMAQWVLECSDATDDTPIRVVGRLSETVADALSEDVLVGYEHRLSDVLEQRPVRALCLYDRDAFSESVLRTVLTQHATYRTPRGVCSNFLHSEPPESGSSDTAGSFALEQVIDVLETLGEHAVRSKQLDVLTAFTESIEQPETERRSHLLESVIALVETLFVPTLSAVWLYDQTQGTLEPATSSQPAFDALEEILPAVSAHAWDTYAGENTITRATIPSADVPAAVSDLPLEAVTFVPLGRHGVLLLVFPDYVSLTETDEALLETIQTTIQTVFDTIRYRETVDTQASSLETQQQRVQELEELISLLQRATQKLVEPPSRADIERTICEQLTRTSSIDFAWFGQPDESAGVLSPTHSSGTGENYLEAVTAHETDASLEPAATTLETGEPTIIDETVTEPPFEPWRSHALRRGYRSIASIPVVYSDSTYGVLTMYASSSNTFDERVRQALETIAETVGHAINAREKRQALISGELTVLDLHVADSSLPSICLADHLETGVRFEEVVSQDDGPPQTYFTVRDCDRTAVEAAVKQCYGIDDLSHIVERENGHLFTSTVTPPCLFQYILERGGIPATMNASADRADVTVELPKRVSTRSFISMLRQQFESVTIISQESRERDFHVRDEFKQAFEDELSDRQKEVLRAAYYSGYFETPRTCTGQDIADQLGVSQPTVTENIRTAERKLVTLLFDAN